MNNDSFKMTESQFTTITDQTLNMDWKWSTFYYTLKHKGNSCHNIEDRHSLLTYKHFHWIIINSDNSKQLKKI